MVRRTNTNSISGKFIPSNPSKYVGTAPPTYRSSWELVFMRMADKHPSITSWAFESIKIPYYNPVLRKYTIYIPDFLIVYQDKNGQQHQEIIEIKPRKETFLAETKNKKDKLSLAVNAAKWKAAAAFCKKHGLGFRVINENDIFFGKRK